MSTLSGSNSLGLAFRITVLLILLVGAVSAGLYFGKRSVPEMPVPSSQPSNLAAVPEPRESQSGSELPSSYSTLTSPPLCFYAGKCSDDVWPVVAQQITLAKGSGISRYIVPVSLDWAEPSQEGELSSIPDLLQKYIDLNDKAELILWINLNPPPSWLAQHPDSALLLQAGLQAYPSLGSPIWFNRAKEILSREILNLVNTDVSKHVIGYVLGALGEQRWILPSEHDLSEANKTAFANWLRTKYQTNEAMAQAWGLPNADFDSIAVPPAPENAKDVSAPVFLSFPQMKPVSDYYHYASDQVADTLAGFISLVQGITGNETLILAPYGFTFELTDPGSGHYSLENLLNSDLDGIIFPVSYIDRGLGGTGGLMGPIDSLLTRGKTCYIIDDTRTGVERDETTGFFSRVKGIRAEDVFEVQRRNFSLAMSCGLGLVWSDPESEGLLNTEDQWQQFSTLKSIYSNYMAQPADPSFTEEPATLTIVVDEAANFCLFSSERICSILLQQGRDMAVRTGINVRFHLLKDILEGTAPPTPVYLFLNAFQLSEEERGLLHARFAGEEACAIWLYAPGYFCPNPDTAGISATTGMEVRAFKEPTSAESIYLLSGQYMQHDQPFGAKETWNPLFYVEAQEDTDFLANYTADNGKGSIAIRTFAEGWTSVYIATPEISAPLLREVIRLLEQPIYAGDAEGTWYDTIIARNDLVAIHASQAGRRSFTFGQFYDIQDLFDPSVGWFQKDNILLTMRTGETRLLRKKEIKVGNN